MKKSILVLALAATVMSSQAQISNKTREQILEMTTEQLTELPLDELMKAVEILGVSSIDELFAVIMNKNVTSASRKEEDSFESPLSSSVITKEEMRSFGCSTIEEALRLLPGVIVREKTNGSYDVHLRGLDNIPDGNTLLYTENTNTLVMIDSRPVFNYFHGATLWESLPIGIEDIDRIEVVRGASGALYGSNAVTGVVNIITERANSRSKNCAGSISVGSMGTAVGDIASRRQIGSKVALSASFNRQVRKRPTDEVYVIAPATPMSSIELYNDGSGAPSLLSDLSTGGYVAVDVIDKLRIRNTRNELRRLTEPEAPAEARFKNSGVARENLGVNGAIYYDDAAAKVSLALVGGYQQSMMQGTTILESQFPFSERTSKTGYVDFRGSIRGATVQLNYFDGPQDLSVGTFGFKVREQQFNGYLDYDFLPTKSLSIRPAVGYQFTMTSDKAYNRYYAYRDDAAKTASFKKEDAEEWGVSRRRYRSFLNDDCKLSQVAFSLKADWRPAESVRLIAAGRADKLSVPDKTFPSWLFAATWRVNDANLLRAVYSRANRSGVILNTSSDYEWVRSDLGEPDYLTFSGNEDADVMSAANIELGYRLKLSNSLMFDIEAFYTTSQDYGSLMSVNTQTKTTGSDIYTALRNMDNFVEQHSTTDLSTVESAMHDAQFAEDLRAMTGAFVTSRSYIQYQNLPYKVKQMGASFRADWVVSKKLVANVSATLQNTKIDNYFMYQQNMAIKQQTDACFNNLMRVMLDLYGHDKKYIAQVFQMVDVAAWKAQNSWFTGSDADLARLTDPNDEQFSPALYYGLVYNMTQTIDPQSGDMLFTIGNAKYTPNKEENGHKHKYTPSVFGSLSLIYKPVPMLSIAPSAYFYGKQEATTIFNASRGAENIDAKMIVNLKIGYRPIENAEVFFDARNLFNDTKREFIYGDKVGGRYSVGVSFGL